MSFNKNQNACKIKTTRHNISYYLPECIKSEVDTYLLEISNMTRRLHQSYNAMIMVNSGSDVVILKCAGQWKTNTVAGDML
eukprot:3224503-Ditylum_brightwellii.AAC.1